MKKILLLIPLFFLTTGCWNYRELNKLAIATAIAVDKADNGYEVSILIANGKNAQTSPKEGQSQNVVYSGKGPTISRALRQIELLIPKQIYIGHLGVVVISDKVAKDGLKNTLDFFVRNPESVKRFYIILSKDDKAKDVIKTLSPLESFPGQSIASNISISNESQAISTSITYSKFIENYLKKGKEPVLPTITIVGKEKEGEKNKILETSSPKAKTKLDKLGIFKKDKLLGYISKNESIDDNGIFGVTLGANLNNITVYGEIYETKYAGGIVGFSANSKIDKCTNHINISNSKYRRRNYRNNSY